MKIALFRMDITDVQKVRAHATKQRLIVFFLEYQTKPSISSGNIVLKSFFKQ